MEEFPDSAGGARSPMAAPRAGSSRNTQQRDARPSAKATDDEDDFGDTDVTSLLM